MQWLFVNMTLGNARCDFIGAINWIDDLFRGLLHSRLLVENFSQQWDCVEPRQTSCETDEASAQPACSYPQYRPTLVQQRAGYPKQGHDMSFDSSLNLNHHSFGSE
jgi:hypothetical protein